MYVCVLLLSICLFYIECTRSCTMRLYWCPFKDVSKSYIIKRTDQIRKQLIETVATKSKQPSYFVFRSSKTRFKCYKYCGSLHQLMDLFYVLTVCLLLDVNSFMSNTYARCPRASVNRRFLWTKIRSGDFFIL